jgi:hypothetical protein
MRDFFINSQTDETVISESCSELIKTINTDIGYDQKELNSTSSEDLFILRKAIYSYLKSPNLKKRNPNYLKLFKRINDELKIRKLLEDERRNKIFGKVIKRNKFFYF